MKGLSFFQKIIYILNVPFGFLLLFSYLANFVNPSFLSFFGLIGLGYPIWLGVNIAFIIIWLISLKRQIFFSLFCVLVGYMQLTHLFQANSVNKEFHVSDKRIKVMTYNVRTFNYRLYEGWQKMAKGIDETIKAEDPDILCIQEYLKFRGMPSITYRYKFVEQTKGNFGLAIYSKFKIINKGEVDFPETLGEYKKFIYADILLENKDTVRVINAHLKSIGLDKTNLSHLKDGEISQQEIETQKRKLIKPLMEAYKIRGNQARILGQFIAESELPVIFCGDLNDTPGSYGYRSVSQYLDDCFVESGSGFSTTVPMFNRYHLPLRIDYIFCDKKFHPFNYQVVYKEYSDHYPVVVDLEY